MGPGFSATTQSSAEPLRPAASTTVGDPVPRHSRYSLRPPISTGPATSGGAAYADSEAVAAKRRAGKSDRLLRIEAALLRQGFGRHPASRTGSMQILRSAPARSRMVGAAGLEPATR